MFLSSRLIKNSRQLEARVSEVAFPGIFKRYSQPQTPCCFVKIHARLLRTMVLKCPRRSTTLNGLNVSQTLTCLNVHSMSFKVGNVCFTILFDGAYFLSAVMVEGDESNWLRMANHSSRSFGRLLAPIDSPDDD